MDLPSLDTRGIAYLRLTGAGTLSAPLHIAYRERGLSPTTRRLIDQVRRMARATTS
ncbi:type 2 periplasmic-binding domain-containing protein [Oleomonas cavernae]|uniref:hypothetical protein n=1 Tax=Oleomonas cavernae TaxID=2320859 RepID=UPI0013141399|nr:hypothetical protein [Oleomonas cavernae]